MHHVEDSVARRCGEASRAHVVPLAVLSALIVLAQVAFYASAPTFIPYPDTTDYLNAASAILQHAQLVAPLRTPGYPLLLSLIFVVDPARHLGVVIGVQTALMVVTSYELYLLAFRLTRQPTVAAIIASLLATSFYVIDWQYTILTETLAFWAAVTLFLLVERLLTRPRPAAWAWFAVLSVFAIMVRPFFVYLPALLLLGLGAHAIWNRRQARPQLVAWCLSGVAIYACVAGYMALNGALNGYAGLSYVSNVNLFGKVMEYRMQDLPVSPTLTPVQQATASYMHAGGDPLFPWTLAQAHGYDRDYYEPVGAYARYVMVHYPAPWSAHVAADAGRVWIEPTFLYAPVATTHLNLPFRLLGRLTPAIYLLLPLLTVLWLLLRWRQRDDLRDPRRFLMLLLLAGVVATVVMVAAGTYFEFYRLREPMDWAAIVVAGGMIYELGGVVAGSLAALVAKRGGRGWRRP